MFCRNFCLRLFFRKRNIDERHLLRLGAGERELREGTMKDFSKFGRVNYTLKRRLELLAEVQRLAESISVEGVRRPVKIRICSAPA